jgi:ribosomal protein S18 acetylase RimI-like enzyme
MTNHSEIIVELNAYPIDNAWAIQDLTLWPERTQIFYKKTPLGFSYLLKSGHPSQERNILVIMSDAGGDIGELFQHLPTGPFLIRETKASLVEKLKPKLPQAKIYEEHRMVLQKSDAQLSNSTRARRVTELDAPALAKFRGAPPQAAEGMKFWIRGAVILAVFENDQIVSMGTTIVRTDAVWDLAAVETLPDFRRKGFATDVVSALCAEAFKFVDAVSLTVLKDNLPALKTYSGLGFQIIDDLVWIDNGTGSRP